MGLFYGDSEKHRREVDDFLFKGEDVLQTYGLLIDFAALTSERLLFVDKTLFSKRAYVMAVPYAKIETVGMKKDRRFSITNKILIMTKKRDFALTFMRGADVMGFYHNLCAHACAALAEDH